MITVEGLTKTFGRTVAVNELTFTVAAGKVTGFLGPNGSGKSTTMRCMIGLDTADSGTVEFDGRTYRSLDRPACSVGVLLDAGYVHPNRKARDHLAWMAASHRLGAERINEVLHLVGLTDVADKRVKEYSLGMKQRLGLAAALLGDPQVVMLDEPANGLDPEGIRWIRDVLVHLAGQGKTVLVSSHQLAEMSQMADDLVVIGQGKLVAAGPLQDLLDRHAQRFVRVSSPHARQLAILLATTPGITTAPVDDTTLEVRGADLKTVGILAHREQIELHELSAHSASLEDTFLELTADATDYRTGTPR